MWPRVSCALVPVIGCISGDRPFGDICYLPGKFVPGVGHVEMLLRLSRGPPPALEEKGRDALDLNGPCSSSVGVAACAIKV